MGEWKSYKFSEFVSINPSVKLPLGEEVSFVEMKDLIDGKRYCYPSSTRKNGSGAKFINRDTLFARITPCLENGKICQVDGLKNGVGLGSTEFLVFRGLPDISDSDFVFYLSRWEDVRSHAEINLDGTSGRQRVPKNCFDELDLILPDNLNEQTAIASILSSLDDKIDLLHRQNTTLEKMAETLFRQWFVEEAKEEWKTDTLGKQFDIGIGRTPPRKEHHWFSENLMDIKWVSIKDMGNSGIYISNVSEYLTREAVERFSIPIIPENTVMLSFKMTIGRLAITTEKMLSNEAIAHFSKKKNSKLFSEFLYLYLKTYQWGQLGSTSSIVESINSQMIKQMEIVIPEENLLMEFKEIIKPYFNKIKSNQTQIRTLSAMRDTLLPKLMSGEVRVEL
jgi:type I restriction enzyme S subunit